MYCPIDKVIFFGAVDSDPGTLLEVGSLRKVEVVTSTYLYVAIGDAGVDGTPSEFGGVMATPNTPLTFITKPGQTHIRVTDMGWIGAPGIAQNCSVMIRG